MKKLKISDNVIRRLPKYIRILTEMSARGIKHTSSSELGKALGFSASQIRQDFNCFGEYGQQGKGYNVLNLRSNLLCILGADRGRNAVLIGAGNLGRALMENFDFSECGVSLKAAFDTDKTLIGTSIAGVHIYDAEELEQFISGNTVGLAILCVPKSVAPKVGERLKKCGIGAIWNFSNTEVLEPFSEVLSENPHFSDSLLVLSYYLTQRKNENERKALRR